ncbi:MAG TPA: MlaD family protein [Baekduia sp.]|nr:MlaD family protein [Baekduia sp.]
MDHRVPRNGVVVGLLLVLAAVATFVFLNSRFEGPSDPIRALSGARQLTATFANTKKLPTKQPVLFKGYEVGRVQQVQWLRDRRLARVTFALKDDFELHEDAVLRIGERSLLGDPYLDVVTRGSRDRRVLGDGDEVADTRTSVNFDEALDFLDARGREDVRSILATVARGVAPAGNGERLNGTVGGVARTVREAHALTSAVRGQEEQIARLVRSAADVLQELGSRERVIRTIVSSGRTTLDALAADTRALERGVTELPRVLGAGGRSLDAVRPLVGELRPPVRALRAAAPDLARALDPEARHSLRTVGADLVAAIDALAPLRRVAEPVLRRELRPLLGDLLPLVRTIDDPARSLVPALDYLTAGAIGTSRGEAIAGLYASVGAATKATQGSRGHYTRAGFSMALDEMFDQPMNACPSQGFCHNAYPRPGDALDPKPFEGTYPRTEACTVPPRSTPREPCR